MQRGDAHLIGDPRFHRVGRPAVEDLPHDRPQQVLLVAESLRDESARVAGGLADGGERRALVTAFRDEFDGGVDQRAVRRLDALGLRAPRPCRHAEMSAATSMP